MFAISEKQDYYEDVRKVICEYIENFQGKLKGILKNAPDVKSGCKYIEKSGMHKNTTWATEIEILATAKSFKYDIFTYYYYRWQRHSYMKNLSQDAIYLDNRAGNHFDVVLAL